MTELTELQLVLIGVIFIWSGFVRSGLGFGGAVLSLPFLLMVDNRPLVYLPLISVHLLVFASLTIWQNNLSAKAREGRSSSKAFADEKAGGTIEWGYLRYALMIMLVPKLIGVFGLILLSNTIMSAIIFVIVGLYSLTYIFNKPFKSKNKGLDIIFLIAGGYISGTSLIGSPLIIAVLANHVPRHKLRDTLFALWLILVAIKMTAFVYAGIDLQLINHLWLLPCAGIGHVVGLRFHDRMLSAESSLFYRVLGSVLLLVSVIGLYQGVLSEN